MKPLKQSHKACLPLLLLLLVAVIATMVMLRGCSTPKAVVADAPVKSEGDTLDIAIDYSPVSMYAEGDSVGGLNYEIMMAIAAKGGLAVKFHPVTSFEDALNHLSEGTYDMVISDVPVTLDFKEQFLQTEPVYLDKQVLVQYVDTALKAEPVETQLDLGGRHVWVVAGSPTAGRLRNLSAEIGDTIYVESDPSYGPELLYMMISIGEIKLCVINEQLAKAMVARGGNAEISANISFTQFQAWVLRRDAVELKERLDSLIDEFKTTDTYKQICNKYLN